MRNKSNYERTIKINMSSFGRKLENTCISNVYLFGMISCGLVHKSTTHQNYAFVIARPVVAIKASLNLNFSVLYILLFYFFTKLFFWL